MAATLSAPTATASTFPGRRAPGEGERGERGVLQDECRYVPWCMYTWPRRTLFEREESIVASTMPRNSVRRPREESISLGNTGQSQERTAKASVTKYHYLRSTRSGDKHMPARPLKKGQQATKNTLGHQKRSGGIGDECAGQPFGHELVRRETSTLLEIDIPTGG